VDKRWYFANGEQVTGRDLERMRTNDKGEHVVDVVDQNSFTGNSVMDDTTGTSHAWTWPIIRAARCGCSCGQ
jgi:hypothetical protein